MKNAREIIMTYDSMKDRFAVLHAQFPELTDREVRVGFAAIVVSATAYQMGDLFTPTTMLVDIKTKSAAPAAPLMNTLKKAVLSSVSGILDVIAEDKMSKERLGEFINAVLTELGQQANDSIKKTEAEDMLRRTNEREAKEAVNFAFDDSLEPKVESVDISELMASFKRPV